MSHIVLFGTVMSILLFATSCGNMGLTKVSNVGATDQSVSPAIVEREWVSKEINCDIHVTTMFFLDEQKGWVSDGSRLQMTKDGGTNWSPPSKPGLSSTFRISQVLFSDERLGWLLAENSREAGFSQKSKSVILITRDGGVTWEIYKDLYSTEGEEMLVDRRGDLLIRAIELYRLPTDEEPSSSPLCYKGVLLKVDSMDSESTSYSERLNDQLESIGPAGCKNQSISGVSIDDSSIEIITGRGEIWRTNDDGASWNRIEFSKDLKVNGVRSFGRLSRQEFWLLSSSQSKDSSGSRFISVSDQISAVFDFTGEYVTTAITVGENTIAIAGMTISPYDSSIPKKEIAVILITYDKGKNWKRVYSNPEDHAVISLAKASRNGIWAITDSGRIVLIREV